MKPESISNKQIEIKCSTKDSLPLSSLINFQGDLKSLSNDNYKKLKTQILKHGFCVPFFVWKDGDVNYILDGHQRNLVLSKMEKEGVILPDSFPVVFVDAKNRKDAAEKLLAINSNYGKMDETSLYNFSNNFDFNFEDLNQFEFPMIKMKSLEKMFNEDNNKYTEEELEEIPEVKETNIKLGDMFQLGEHRLLCGDATSEGDVKKLMGEQLADLIFTDPPYNVNYKQEGQGSKNNRIKTNINFTDSFDDFGDFLNKFISNYYKFSKDEASLYMCYALSQGLIVEQSINNSNYIIRNHIIWVKDNAVLSFGRYRYQHEPILYCYKNGKTDSWYGDKTQTTCWQISSISSFNNKDENNKNNTDKDNVNHIHPTQKPLGIPKKAIENSSKKNDLILDLFGGSGSTLIACEITDRKCYTSEIIPHYCQVIIDRWEKLTKQKAIQIN